MGWAPHCRSAATWRILWHHRKTTVFSILKVPFDVNIQQYVADAQIYIALTTADVTAHLTRLSSCLSVLHNGSVITALHLIAANQSPFCLAPGNVFATSL